MSTSSGYLFLMATMLFGLPLLIGYYGLDFAYTIRVLIPYLIVSAVATILLIVRARKANIGGTTLDEAVSLQVRNKQADNDKKSSLIEKFIHVPKTIILIFVASTLILFGNLDFITVSSYPFPPPLATVTLLGELYILLLFVTAALVIPRILWRAFPDLPQILEQRKYALIGIIFASCFALVYLLLVNQIIIAGYNVQLTVPASLVGGTRYPYAFAMTPAVVNQPLLDLVYLPVVIVQLSPQINLILIPFEMIFVTLLSFLVATNVVMAHYLITRRSGFRCSTRGTAISTGGSFLGLTATCPTCLTPTIVSVIFGGVSTATTIFSNFNGVVLPPVLSVAALLLSAWYLSRGIKKSDGTL